VGGIRPRKVASPNPLVTAVADMTRRTPLRAFAGFDRFIRFLPRSGLGT
jgi:hypothetical protein